MPTIDIPDKICPHCGGTRYMTENRKKPTRSNPNNVIIRYRCVVKSNERVAKWAMNNFDKYKAYRKNYIPLPKPEGYWKTPKMKEHYRLKSKRESEQLTDNFVKNKILGHSGSLARTNLSFKDITPELIELKRKQIQLYRQLKSNKWQVKQ